VRGEFQVLTATGRARRDLYSGGVVADCDVDRRQVRGRLVGATLEGLDLDQSDMRQAHLMSGSEPDDRGFTTCSRSLVRSARAVLRKQPKDPNLGGLSDGEPPVGLAGG
jgi:hypothetical protein